MCVCVCVCVCACVLCVCVCVCVCACCVCVLCVCIDRWMNYYLTFFAQHSKCGYVLKPKVSLAVVITQYVSIIYERINVLIIVQLPIIMVTSTLKFACS